jgi:hypothetical protein
MSTDAREEQDNEVAANNNNANHHHVIFKILMPFQEECWKELEENATEAIEEIQSGNNSDPLSCHNNPFGGPYTQQEYTFMIAAGTVLAFNSGFVNGTCLSGLVAPSDKKQAAASFTGTMTRSAMELGDGDYDRFSFLIAMVLCFVMGSCLSSLLTPNPTKFRIEPTYGPTFLIGAGFLIATSILSALEMQEDLVFYLAAAANGI